MCKKAPRRHTRQGASPCGPDLPVTEPQDLTGVDLAHVGETRRPRSDSTLTV